MVPVTEITPSKIRKLLSRSEGAKLDFKQQLSLATQRDKLEFSKDVCAIANTSNGHGYIVIGIEDKTKRVLGINPSSINEARLQQIISSRSDPPPRFSVEFVYFKGANLAIIYIPRRTFAALHQVKGVGFPIRRGSTTDTMTTIEIFATWQTRARARRIQTTEDLRAIGHELGVRPSDIFLADKILFVEGHTDAMFYRILAKKLRMDLDSPTISVIPMGGRSKGKRYLKAWAEITRNIPVSVSMILDKDAKSEAEKLIKEKLATRRQISVLSKGTIEDYFDKSILMKVMNEKYPGEFTENNLKPSQSEGLMEFLKNKHKDWKRRSRAKYEIGETVATRMSTEQIHTEIRDALLQTKDQLELP